MKFHFRRLLEHSLWANRRVLEALRQPEASDRALGWFAHVLAAEEIWLGRLQGRASAVEVFPKWTLEECTPRVEDSASGYLAYLDSLEDDAFDDFIRYQDTRGRGFVTSIGEILTHVCTHGGYHRGQIASDLRASGGEPVNTDFITFTRE